MDDYKHSVMIALLPMTTAWSKIALPHLTLIYAGEISDLKPSDFNEMGKTASVVAQKYHPFQLLVQGFDVFGEEPSKVEVFKLRSTSELMQIHREFQGWNATGYPYNPHVTIGPVGSFVAEMEPPRAIAFDRILVQWGEQELKFWLKPWG